MDENFETGRQLQAEGRFAEAEEVYRELLDENPDSVRILNNLGTSLESQGKLGEAFTILMRARELDDQAALVRYNLAQVLYRQDRTAAAIDQFREAVRLDPDLSDGRLNLAVLLWREGDLEGAEATLRETLERDPEHAESHSRLGMLLFDLGRLAEAAACHEAVLRLRPEDPDEHFLLGRALSALGRADEAADAFARSLAVFPGDRTTHEHRVRALRLAGRHDELEEAFSAWLAALPGDPVAEHLLAAAGNDDGPSRASDEYVRAEFDGFASDYDQTLARLGYRGPQLLHNAVHDALGPGRGELRALDAGCGTGLCGDWLRDYAATLIGVDLSPAMLDEARNRGSYDDLVEAELTAHLAGVDSALDLIVAADTFIYFGALDALIDAAAGALAPAGLLVFSVEDAGDSAGDGYRLQPNGRYAHGEDYLRAALARSGFECLAATPDSIRSEGGQPVPALIVTARAAGV